jgi:nicotinamidase/pyrazinamidase
VRNHFRPFAAVQNGNPRKVTEKCQNFLKPKETKGEKTLFGFGARKLDARQLGLKTYVVVDGCRGIELEPSDIRRAIDEVKRVGAILLKSSDL